jgi:hypothetical protein
VSIRKRFNEIFGLKDTFEEERKRFVNRVNQDIFHIIDTEQYIGFQYDELFGLICSDLGVNSNDVPDRRQYGGLETPTALIRTLTGDDFEKTLLVLCILYDRFESFSNRQKWLSQNVQSIISQSTCNIGVRWKVGFFYPNGAKELDESLIDETLVWLKDYPNEKKDYQQALEHYLRDKSSGDVIKNCYSAIEGLARNILGNDKTLDNNKDELLSKIKLSDGWKAILANFIKYAHDFRHASEQRHEITKQETEGYLYMTGLVIRLIIESKQIG